MKSKRPSLHFAKYQGLGNDFLIVDLRSEKFRLSFSEVIWLCDRRLGVGGDGVLCLLPASTADAVATMQVLNADGSEAEMCGNGLRCVAKYLAEPSDTSLMVDTGAGPLLCQLAPESVSVSMGQPEFLRAEIPMTGPATAPCLEVPYQLGGQDLTISAVSMGNPHAIAFVPQSGDALIAQAEQLGPLLENHADFPSRTNAEFAHLRSRTSIELVVWERGCGITQACGTGACATVVAACQAGHCEVETDVEVILLGGSLVVCVAADYSQVTMSGPAEHVFSGHVEL